MNAVSGLPAGRAKRVNPLQYDRDYTWNDNGELIRISSPRQTRSYSYSTTGRLTSVHTTAANLDIRIPYATDPAGNRLPDPELHPDSTLSMWPDNRIARDAHWLGKRMLRVVVLRVLFFVDMRLSRIQCR